MANAKLFTTVLLDVPRRIRYSNRAHYRVGTLERPLPLRAIAEDGRSITALAQWIWAMLDEDHPFKSPEDVAEVITDANAQGLIDGIQQAYDLAQPKNEASSTPGPSQSSS